MPLVAPHLTKCVSYNMSPRITFVPAFIFSLFIYLLLSIYNIMIWRGICEKGYMNLRGTVPTSKSGSPKLSWGFLISFWGTSTVKQWQLEPLVWDPRYTFSCCLVLTFFKYPFCLFCFSTTFFFFFEKIVFLLLLVYYGATSCCIVCTQSDRRIFYL